MILIVDRADEDVYSRNDEKGHHVTSSLSPVAIRHTALQPHTFLCQVDSGGSVALVGKPPVMVYVCVCGDVDRLIWGLQRCADGGARGRSSNGRGTRSTCDPDDC